jgi:hypothetical protein
MVGPNGLEPSTSSVSGRRSNQLSYGPTTNYNFITVPVAERGEEAVLKIKNVDAGRHQLWVISERSFIGTK